MSTEVPEKFSYSRRMSLLAEQRSDATAITFIPQEGDPKKLSWRELDQASNQIARLFAHHGVDENSLVVVGLKNSIEHYLVTFAIWKIGALPLPLRSAMPERERDQILELAQPKVVVADWENVPFPTLSTLDLAQASDLSDQPLPDKVSNPGKAMASGGSTGRSKIIITPGPWSASPGKTLLAAFGVPPNQIQLVAGPLYHNAPFLSSHIGLFEGHTLVVMERFNAAQIPDLVEQYQIQFIYLAPIMMDRISKLPDINQRDLSSINTIFHTASPCPPWLKRAWIDLVGAEAVLEIFGATELVGLTVNRGNEWLAHPGTVGRPLAFCEMKIFDPSGNELPPGEVGEIFMRRIDIDQSYYYLGASPAKTNEDGFASVGDLGWVDEDGYLFIADRRVDLIITGGANVYPAEVEAALTENPNIGDVAVIGIPDDEWGKRVHAIIEFNGSDKQPTVQELDAHCRERLMSYKVPKSYEFVEQLPRDPAGKIRRLAMVQARESGWTSAMIAVKGNT